LISLDDKIDQLEDDLHWAKLTVDMEIEKEGDAVKAAPGNRTPPAEQPPVFSDLCDPHGHNCRAIPKSTIDCIITSYFQARREVQLDKIRGMKAEVLRMDWDYKLAPKVKVYAGRGKPFSPFKSSLCWGCNS